MHSLILNITISVFTLFIINYILTKNKILIDNPKLSQHKFMHNSIIPLSGGIFFITCYTIISQINQINISIIIYLIPFLFIGIIADIKKNFSPKIRLILQLIFLILIVYIFDIRISSIDLKFFDEILKNNYFNFFFSIFCLITILNGYNLMDGLNGFVSGQMLMIIISLILLINLNNLEYANNLQQIIEIFFSIFLIFFLFNIFGKCFLGDNGTYIFSLFLSILIISFIEKSGGKVSPLLAAIFLWYPAYENLFTILRRINKKKIISKPDVLHLHTLLKNFIFLKFQNKFSNTKLNSIAGIVINISLMPNFFLGILWYDNSTKLTFLIILQIFVYMFAYLKLAKKYS